jgi:hypothetical protein
MASLRLALKASMEGMGGGGETKKTAATPGSKDKDKDKGIKTDKADKEKEKKVDGGIAKTPRTGAGAEARAEPREPRAEARAGDSQGKGHRPAPPPQPSGGSPLGELAAYKLPRKNSRLSDTHSTASDDSGGRGSTQGAAVASVRKSEGREYVMSCHVIEQSRATVAVTHIYAECLF